MSAAWGQYLVDAVLREKSLRTLRERGIVPDMLQGPARAALQYLYDYAARSSTFDQVPPREVVQQMIPVIEWPPQCMDTPTDVRVLCDLVLGEYAQAQVAAISAELVETSGTDPFAAVRTAISKLMTLDTSTTQGSLHAANLEQEMCGLVKAYHQRLLLNNGMAGIPYPFPGLNRITLGMQPGEFVFVYGIPKSMKTWVVLRILSFLMQYDLGRVLVYTPEVFKEEFSVRLASLLTETDYTDVLRGWGLSNDPQVHAKIQRFYAILEWLEWRSRSPGRMQPFTLLHGEVNLRQGDPLAFLTPQIETYEPHVIFVDSAYLLTEDVDSKFVAKLGRSAKLLAQRTGTTVFLTSQENAIKAYEAANRGRTLGASSASFGQGFVQNLDLGIHVVLQPFMNGFRLALNTFGRKAKEPGIVISGNPGHDMNEIEGKAPFDLAHVLEAQRRAAAAQSAAESKEQHGGGEAAPPRSLPSSTDISPALRQQYALPSPVPHWVSGNGSGAPGKPR